MVTAAPRPPSSSPTRRRPDIVYTERMTLRFGGKTIELVFPGKNHANDGTAVLFTDERVLFTVDFPRRRAGAGLACARCPAPAALRWTSDGRVDQVLSARSRRWTSTSRWADMAACRSRKKDITEGARIHGIPEARGARRRCASGMSLAQMKQTHPARALQGLALLRGTARGQHRGGVSQSEDLQMNQDAPTSAS